MKTVMEEMTTVPTSQAALRLEGIPICVGMDAYFPDDDYGELVRRLKEEFDKGSVASVAFLAMRKKDFILDGVCLN